MFKRKKIQICENLSPNLIDIRDFLPLGSIVKLEDGQKYLIHRIAVLDEDVKSGHYDYAAVSYPNAMFEDKELRFNHADIKEILHKGYIDEEYAEHIELMASIQHI